MIKRIIYTYLIIFLFTEVAWAQQEAYNWTFGNKAGLTWNGTRTFTGAKRLYPTASAGYVTLNKMPVNLSRTPQVITYEGCFSMSDPETGALLFYSDGMNIWDDDGTPLASNLGGHRSSSQSGVIMPYPGLDNKNKYIVLSLGLHTTTTRINYAVIDMNDANGNLAERGRVIEQNQLLEPITDPGSDASIFGESMNIIPHANKKDFWIVAPGKGEGNNSAFYAWKVTKDGVDKTNPKKTILPLSTAFITTNITNLPTGYFRFSPDGKSFAWPTGSSLVNTGVYFGQFNANDGTFSNIKLFKTPGTPAYGAEFSASGKYLYIQSAARLRVFNFENLMNAPVTNTEVTYTADSDYSIREDDGDNRYGLGALQLGPDGNIYSTFYNVRLPAPNDDNVTNFRGGTKHMIVITTPEMATGHTIYKLENFLTGEGHIGITSFSPAWFATGIRGPVEVCSGMPDTYSLAISQNAIDTYNLTKTIWKFSDGSAPVTINITSAEVILPNKSFTISGQTEETVTISVEIYDNTNSLLSTETYEVKVLPLPSFTVSVNDVCVGSSEIMTVNDLPVGATVKWYRNMSDTTPYQVGHTCSTGTQSTAGTITFYVEVENTTGCSSGKTPVNVTVKNCGYNFIPVNPHLRGYYKN
jgi:hypothetical protein